MGYRAVLSIKVYVVLKWYILVWIQAVGPQTLMTLLSILMVSYAPRVGFNQIKLRCGMTPFYKILVLYHRIWFEISIFPQKSPEIAF